MESELSRSGHPLLLEHSLLWDSCLVRWVCFPRQGPDFLEEKQLPLNTGSFPVHPPVVVGGERVLLPKFS